MKQEKQIYRVIGPIRHDGEFYRPDDDELNTIELTDKEARPLLAIGAVSVIGDETEDKSTDGETKTGAKKDAVEAPTDQAVRIDAIKEAIGKLEPENGAHWLKDGKTPEVKALEELLGWGIKAEERNQAMLELHGDQE